MKQNCTVRVFFHVERLCNVMKSGWSNISESIVYITDKGGLLLQIVRYNAQLPALSFSSFLLKIPVLAHVYVYVAMHKVSFKMRVTNVGTSDAIVCLLNVSLSPSR